MRHKRFHLDNFSFSRGGGIVPHPDVSQPLPRYFIRDKIMKRIPLTQGKFVIVDDENYEWLNQYKWCAVKNRYTYYAKIVREVRE